MTFTVRAARLEDARGIAVVHVESWRSTYRGLIDADYLASLAVDPREARWRQILTDMKCATKTFALVAEDETGSIVGFASGGPERERDAIYAGELTAVYVLDPAHGRGLGRRLVGEIARRLVATGQTSMLVWVLAANPACRFYERLGGVELRRKQAPIGGRNYELVAYGWRDGGTLVAPSSSA